MLQLLTFPVDWLGVLLEGAPVPGAVMIAFITHMAWGLLSIL